MIFPAPQKLNNCTRWRLSALLAYEAAQLGEPAPKLAPENERFLSDRQLAERFNVARSTIWRWTRESEAAQ